MSDFSIELTENEGSSSEQRARLAVFIKRLCATSHLFTAPGELDYADQIQQEIIVDPYPLAEWLATNWWRLRWEAECTGLSFRQQQDWNMSHRLAAAGGGFSWPNITFAPDDETVLCTVEPTDGSLASIRFVQDIQEHITAESFEQGIDDFVSKVTSKLPANDNLSVLWQEVQDERANSELSLIRKLEAKAGFDPDEAPARVLEKFHDLIERFGPQSVAELASARLGNRTEDIDQLLVALSKSPYIMRPELPSSGQLTPNAAGTAQPFAPWQKAAHAARKIRESLGVTDDPVTNARICDYLAISAQVLNDSPSNHLPSAGLRTAHGINIQLNAARETSRRFGLSRLLGDVVHTRERENLLHATNAKTARQKFQRAFAQELLCPYERLMEWVDTESPDDELLENTADHFQVSPLVAKYAYQNKAA